MRKIKFNVVFVLLISLVLVSGCGAKGPAKSPNDVIKTSVQNLLKVNSRSLSAAVSGSYDVGKDAAKEQTLLDVKVVDKRDTADQKNPKVDLDLSGNITVQGVKYDGEVAVKVVGGKIYANLLKYPDSIKDSPIAMFTNKWFFVPMEQSGSAAPLFGSSSSSPEMQQLEDEFNKVNLLKDLKYEDTEDFAGVKAYKYTGSLDKDQLLAFIVKAGQTNGKAALTEQEQADMKKQLSTIDVPLTIFVSVDGETLVGAKGVLNVKDDVSNTNAAINFDIQISDLNKPVSVEAPSGAIDAAKAFGGSVPGLGAAQPATKVPAAKK